MRVFVTGAAGFVGTRLLPRLRAAGLEVVGADAEVDVTREGVVRASVARVRPDAVIHLAAMSSVALSRRQPAACYRVNFLGTRSLLGAVAREAPKARVLLIGSGDTYSTTAPSARPYRESDPLRPSSPYGFSKAAAELLGSEFARRGLDVVRVRAFNHTGPGQTDSFVASSFARQVSEVSAGLREPVLRVGNLESIRDFLDVDDVLEAYRLLLDPSVRAGIYNVASGRPISIRSLLEQLIELAGVSPRIEIDPDRVRPTDQLLGDATRLRKATGWQRRVPLRTTLAALLADWSRRVSPPAAGS